MKKELGTKDMSNDANKSIKLGKNIQTENPYIYGFCPQCKCNLKYPTAVHIVDCEKDKRKSEEMNVKTYRKKPVEIEAMAFGPTPREVHEVTCWMEDNLYPGLIGNALDPNSLRYPDQLPEDDSRPDKGWYIDPADGLLVIRTLEGDMRAEIGDYIIRGVQGEIYPCKPDIFAATYEEVAE